jgi:hypothetical protein
VKVSPAGRKQKNITHFSFFINNNSPTIQPVYRKYLRYNKKRMNKF